MRASVSQRLNINGRWTCPFFPKTRQTTRLILITSLWYLQTLLTTTGSMSQLVDILSPEDIIRQVAIKCMNLRRSARIPARTSSGIKRSEQDGAMVTVSSGTADVSPPPRHDKKLSWFWLPLWNIQTLLMYINVKINMFFIITLACGKHFLHDCIYTRWREFGGP